MKRTQIIIIILLCTLTRSFAQEVLSLDHAILLALKNNQSIQIAENNAEISRNNAHPGAAGLLPKLDLTSGVSYSNNDLNTGTMTMNETSTLSNAGIQLSYNLFNGFQGLFTYKKLKSNAEFGRLQARLSVENDILQVVTAYYSVARAQESFQIVQEAARISEERLLRVSKKNLYGQADKIEVLNAQVDLNADSVSFYNLALNLDEAKRNLNVLLNRDVEHKYLIDSEVAFPDSFVLERLRQTAFQRNATFLLAGNQVEQAKYDLKIARAGYLPRVDFQSSYGYNKQAKGLDFTFDDPNRTFTAGATFSFNLFNGRQNHIQRQNAQIAIENQQLQQEEGRLNLLKEVKNSYAGYQNSRYILEVQQRNFESVELNFQRTKELYELGQLTATQFREAQLNLIRAKNNITNAKFDAKSLEFQLRKLSGQLVRMDKTQAVFVRE